MNRAQRDAIEHARSQTRRCLRLIDELRSETLREFGPGFCPFCQDPLPPSRTKPRLTCSTFECRQSYARLYGAERTRLQQEARR